MINKVTVFEFVTEFNNFYNNVLHLIEEAYNNSRMTRNYYMPLQSNEEHYYRSY